MKTISCREQLSELVAKLRTSDSELYFLPSSALVNLLNRFLTGEIVANDIETLADALEMNESVTYEETRKQIIADTLFVLSNPEINGFLNPANAKTLIHRLEAV